MNHSLKLCFIAASNNIHTKRWLQFFIEQGHQVFCLSDKEGEIPGAEVFLLPNRDTLLGEKKKAKKKDVIQARAIRIKELVAEIQPDIVHAHYLYLRGWSAALADVRPLIISLWGSDIQLEKVYYRNAFHLFRDQLLNRLALTQADMITGMSPNLARLGQKAVGKHIPVEVVPLGANLEQFQANLEPEKMDAFRASLHIPSDSLIVLSPRIMVPLYNIETIIDSIPKVLEELPNTVFILKDTVSDTEERRNYVSELRQHVERLGVGAAVRWVNELPYESLPMLYTLADVIVSIPTADGMPVTLFEAMACGTPVIVGNLVTYDSVIDHNKTGLRIPPKDSAALSLCILQLLKNPQLSEQLVQAAYGIVKEFGNYQYHLKRMEKYYFQLASLGNQSKSSLWRRFTQFCFRQAVSRL